MSTRKVFPGQVYGWWTVLSGTQKKHGATHYECECRCGNIGFHPAHAIISGHTTKCKQCANTIRSRGKSPDLSGMRFGSWLVIERAEINPFKSGGAAFLCKCDCGFVSHLKSANLRRGLTRQCMQCKAENVTGGMFSHYAGHAGLTGRYFGMVRLGALRRGLEFSITPEYAWEKYQQQDGRCALTGVPIPIGRKPKEQLASIDRIDSLIGYTEGNIQWVHKIINFMKLDLAQCEFVDWARKVATYSGGVSWNG